VQKVDFQLDRRSNLYIYIVIVYSVSAPGTVASGHKDAAPAMARTMTMF
jgi:hypothetical protein